MKRRASANRRNRVVDCGRSISLVLALLAVLAGCGGDERSDVTPTALGLADASATTAAAALASGSGSTPTAAPSPEYGEVVWTTAVDPTTKEPTEPVDAFVVDAPTLYAVIPVRNVPRDTTLTAEWMYNATSLDSLTTSVAAASGIADGWIAFHLTRSAEPWPDGTYAISISVLGRVVQTAEIAVEHR